jgi:teichuronic acid biosynthesis glycosyltransferase TuaG
MTIYNRPELIPAAIDSILNQTYTNFELILFDDGSTNPEVQPLLKSYEAKDPRIKVYKAEKNLGQAEAKNAAIALAQGKYFAIMDSDDHSMPTRLEV